ncbi:5'-methylthioadenosine/S-adenosylhomocysteine nucleosidase [Grimontia hollisae]|uniref:5'-methylthioadenosine/S-adenosylhomocysteine nucleosidase n=1 Tax=Grimontia hollisae CIP 101886 TaxID=675812 RepID=D0I860_GRIHO|nr:5'-methylthioadenosine/S-adenosylhomocysteine nucleosidase [Grimontia hollisae]AMG31047.1 5'-methylthioadenosine/S-adenosylhomocysteine nucleosidase [Grimontia hollisae]EEY72829.1 5'-methylthioadenosine nucleosidase/S-adenosylhomocysteine nucleosidase [Grimontia hollisae CIP 101886]MDF2184403.1 5'-methylthioadenosine/S-adenosylhomocysteine nucleosidase [Grimontia hollisae]STO46819.1 5'-methylthioadenosine/S-adenosylhomocysteine nucleosidase [Grimontia hollisae]
MKIGIIGAMEQEVALLKNKMNNCQLQEIGGNKFYTGDLNGVNVVLLQSGIGKVAAAVGTSILLERFKPTAVINTGSAGGFDSSLNLGDVVISTDVAYHDADVTAFGYTMGQMAGQPATFTSDEKLMDVAEQALAAMDPALHAVRGLICTGDTFVCTAERQNYIREHFPSVIAVEMEAAAIAQACHQFKVPFVVVRAISDVADKESPMTFDEFLPLAAKSSSAMVEKMVDLLNA